MTEPIDDGGPASKATCGPLYKAGLESFTGMDPDKIPIFAAGFISGQAEKIYLGACQAAMFRPPKEWVGVVSEIAHEVADRYGLEGVCLPTSRGEELWMVRSPAVRTSILGLLDMPENSPEWHERRGLLCGVPPYHIDVNFHERSGYGVRCD